MSDGLFTPTGLPEGLLDLGARDLHRRLPGPTLLRLPGRRERPLFTAVLQHGNETVGWDAVRALLGAYRGRSLPRTWWVFIGNVHAARHDARRLDAQPDFNRCWPGATTARTPVHDMLEGLTDLARRHRPVASIDVHSNTGRNPHYAAVNALRPASLNLAALFSRTALFFTVPGGVQSAAFETFCPSVTVECGVVGNEAGTAHAFRYLDACLHLESVPSHRLHHGDLALYRTVARITVPPEVEFGFGEPGAALNLAPDLDALNFHPVPAGTALGRVVQGLDGPVRAHDLEGRDVTSRYFGIHNGELVTTRPVTPSMLTLNHTVIRQDCLGYLMETVDIPAAR